ncbi:MAG: TonB-dependent receptor, partial [Bacteroidales bacterium]|nr:TonB-dependent receptor [Bacteroidales bacterium]
MSFRKLILFIVCLLATSPLWSQVYSIKGQVVSAEDSTPIEYATILIETTGQWAVADKDGRFVINKVPAGKIRINVSSLSYVTDIKEFILSKDIEKYRIALKADNLALDGAVVTAKENSESATTSRSIDRTALDHVQLMNVADISSLLPGGTTASSSLLSDQQFSIRSGATAGEFGSSSFATAVEVDGVRLSNNASFAGVSSTSTSVKGASTSNIASSNVESVEVISGVPSVEYGDMTNGVVKISTRQGKTPVMITFSTSPSTKQVSASKGFGLGTSREGKSRGTLNASAEYARSIANLMSPYKSYDRKQLSLNWNNVISSGALASTPLKINIGVTGNLGGLDDSRDPDSNDKAWLKGKDHTIRGNFSLDWLLSKSWITNLELKGSIQYSDKSTRECKYYSSASSKVALHSTEKGYYIAQPYSETGENPAVLIPQGYWTNILNTDDRPLSSKLSLKGVWAKNTSIINSKLKLGGDWTTDSNFGRGLYTENMANAETYRPWPYCNVPTMHNAAAYLEEDLVIHIGKGSLNLVAGLRNDNTIIRGSAYGVTSSLSPRFNARYNILTERYRRDKAVRSLSVRGSWGIAVKQPSFGVLYPTPTYRDVQIFASPSNSQNVSYTAWYTLPRSYEYNPNLRYQQSRQAELGFDINILGTKISLAGFYSVTTNAYRQAVDYESISYNYTPITSIIGSPISADDWQFSINKNTGVITVSDAKGSIPSYELAYIERREMSSRIYPANQASPLTRYGIEWVIDFTRIEPINTTIRLDGTWYNYYGISTDMIAATSTVNGYDGLPFRYVGYYYGDNATSNGRKTSTIRNNITITTHIPSIRLIISAKLESCLMNYSRALSERADG